MHLSLAVLLFASFVAVTHQSPVSIGSGHGSFGPDADSRFDSDLRTAIMRRLLTGKAVKVGLETDRRLAYEQDKECSTCGEPPKPATTVAPPMNIGQLCLQALGPPGPGCWYNGLGAVFPLTCPVTCLPFSWPTDSTSTTLNPIILCLQQGSPPPGCWYTGQSSGYGESLPCAFSCPVGPF